MCYDRSWLLETTIRILSRVVHCPSNGGVTLEVYARGSFSGPMNVGARTYRAAPCPPGLRTMLANASFINLS